MMYYGVIYSAMAKKDLEIAHDYIAQTFGNPDSARDTIRYITKKCDSLKLFPRASPIKYESRNLKMRFARAGKYTIIFSVDSGTNSVIIQRIFYSRRNIRTLLEE